MEIEKRIEKFGDGTYIELYHKKGDISFWHRENGPAIIEYNKDGSIEYEIYYVDNNRHKEDGPARIGYNKDGSIYYEEFWVNAKHLTKEEWYEKYAWKKQLKDTPMGEILLTQN